MKTRSMCSKHHFTMKTHSKCSRHYFGMKTRSMTSYYHFPPEIWEHIVSFVNSKACLKSLSLVSKTLYYIVCKKMWASADLKNPEALALWKNCGNICAISTYEKVCSMYCSIIYMCVSPFLL